SQVPDVDSCLRAVAGAARLLLHGRSQPALAVRPGTDRRAVRRNSSLPSHGSRLYRPRFGALFDYPPRVAFREATTDSTHGSSPPVTCLFTPRRGHAAG